MIPALSKIILIGVGLIGGSLMLDLKRKQRNLRVVGIDLDRENLTRALERRVIDEAHHDIRAALFADAELVLIATPVNTLPEICRQLAPLLPARAVISDVGSTKQTALSAFRQHLPHHFPRCVATHPIAGSDRSGALAAQFGLYQNQKLIITPHETQDSGSLNAITALWQSVGAQVHHMSAAEHDTIFAAVSHFPHLLAFSYVHQLLDHPNGADYLPFAGSGFRDFTRIAASHATMWKDIFLANRESLLHLIAAQQTQLELLKNHLQNNHETELLHYIQQAKTVREQWGGQS